MSGGLNLERLIRVDWTDPADRGNPAQSNLPKPESCCQVATCDYIPNPRLQPTTDNP